MMLPVLIVGNDSFIFNAHNITFHTLVACFTLHSAFLGPTVTVASEFYNKVSSLVPAQSSC